MSFFSTQILDQSELDLAISALQSDEVVAIPTETVYGLAGNALSSEAVQKIYKAKGRPSDNPLIVHIASIETAKPLIKNDSTDFEQLAKVFWPGPLTMILPRSNQIPLITAGGLDTVALRMPDHPVALKIIYDCGFPLAAPSANLSGKPSPTTAKHVYDDLHGRIPYIVDGGPCQKGIESTVLSLIEEPYRILRPGTIRKKEIEAVLSKTIAFDSHVFNPFDSNKPVASPGMKYRHYSPDKPLTLFFGSTKDYVEIVKKDFSGALCFEEDIPFLGNFPSISYGSIGDIEEQLTNLFSSLRLVDTLDSSEILVHVSSSVDANPLINRLLRSSSFTIIGDIPSYLKGSDF